MTDKVTTIRAPKTSNRPYFSTARATPQNRALSWEARGMLWYLLSKPDDWELQPKDLEQECGRDKVYRVLKELREAGYLIREEIRDEKQRIRGYIYRVHEIPESQKPLPEKPYTVEPYTEKPYITDKRIDKVESQQIKEITPDGENPISKPEKRTRPAKEFNPYKDALAAAYGWEWERISKAEAGQIQAAAAQLFDIQFPVTDIPALVAYCRKEYDKITPPGCCGHVSEWREKQGSAPKRQEIVRDGVVVGVMALPGEDTTADQEWVLPEGME